MSVAPISAPLESNVPAAATNCSQCRCQLTERYFQANGKTLCERCLASLQQFIDGKGSSTGRFFKAVCFGFGAALLGALGYGLWMGFTNSEFAFVTIAIGWFVGMAVRRGSCNRGGWRYGLLAVALTYLAISLSFTGVAVTQALNARSAKLARVETQRGENVAQGHTPSATPSSEAPATKPPAPQQKNLFALVLKLVVLGLSMPVVSASQSILSLVITGFGMWKAWTINRAAKIVITGPHPVGSTSLS
jgi:hypothetical protein